MCYWLASAAKNFAKHYLSLVGQTLKLLLVDCLCMVTLGA